MSELKARKFFEAVPTSKEGFYQPGAFVDGYLKPDADKVIAKLKNSIAPTKESDKTLQERLNEVCEKHGVSTLQDLDWAFCESEKRHTKYCIEVNKVIAEKDEEIAELKKKYEGVKNECNYWCNNLKVFAKQKKYKIAKLKEQVVLLQAEFIKKPE